MEMQGKGDVLGELKRLSAKLLDSQSERTEEESFINQAGTRDEELQVDSEEETDDILLM